MFLQVRTFQRRVKDLDVILPLKREEEEESSNASVVRDTRNAIGFEDP
jgi:hypothetical protein